ncbi:MAG: SH3 domain-containing protein [Pyrinomonadaceae bacterium]
MQQTKFNGHNSSAAVPPHQADEQSQLRSGAASPSRLLRSVLTPLILLLCFSGILLATHSYFSRALSNTRGADSNSPLAGREAIAETDINLRPDPSLSNQRVGIVEYRSRVRIIKTKGNWAEVEIIERGREPSDLSGSSRGWVDQNFLDLQRAR